MGVISLFLAFPDATEPTKTITLEEGKSSVINCDIPHTFLDSVRWYKVRKQTLLLYNYNYYSMKKV